ncbi:hypothetical protein GJ496_011844 [Pomphorhynchus laevis]|nr:hypothetical protein GJ496_011844 [Pomphorhynchus laevis]
MDKRLMKALNEVKAMDEIIICKADKGNTAVIWDCTQHKNEGLRQLQSESYGTTTDLIDQAFYKMKELINSFISNKILQTTGLDKLLKNGYKPGNFYMLPKIRHSLLNESNSLRELKTQCTFAI